MLKLMIDEASVEMIRKACYMKPPETGGYEATNKIIYVYCNFIIDDGKNFYITSA